MKPFFYTFILIFFFNMNNAHSEDAVTFTASEKIINNVDLTQEISDLTDVANAKTVTFKYPKYLNKPILGAFTYESYNQYAESSSDLDKRIKREFYASSVCKTLELGEAQYYEVENKEIEENREFVTARSRRWNYYASSAKLSPVLDEKRYITPGSEKAFMLKLLVCRISTSN